MKSKINYDIYNMAVRAMVSRQTERVSKEINSEIPNYSYSAGYMESLIANMLCDLPKAKRDMYLRQIMESK